MTQPVPPPSDDAASLQFDRAEFTEAPSAPKCSVCQRAIKSVYYDLNTRLLCPACREDVEAAMTGGSKAKRFLTASVFGFGAAIAGALLYWGVGLTGYNIGLIAIAVGWMVGTAVFKGSESRGGWVYQVLAVGLTYFAVAASLAPDVYKELTTQPPAEVATDAPAEETEAVSPAVNVVLAGVISVAAPVLVGINSPLSGLIYGFALFEAWRRTKRTELNIAGPFKLAEAPAEGEAAPAEQERSVG
ncbi:hypothetical protein D7Y15_11310 [Corallococcus sp. AB030]|uniref:hypothetical protein n=1 Tax=Corallococcus TaxID=83461 RepID=UPI000EA09689|nr:MULTISPECIES: hypothetical protein [Corallococcus]NRD53382.1 hypothetical protein [Corallococcus exiguus]RKH24581.1 hypothetical protein D7V77_20265 [Corallococcus sp. CA041A]RKI16965.1 hypothetical protein D7Y15_11310 [Corallococcus sp. AB030]